MPGDNDDCSRDVRIKSSQNNSLRGLGVELSNRKCSNCRNKGFFQLSTRKKLSMRSFKFHDT